MFKKDDKSVTEITSYSFFIYFTFVLIGTVVHVLFIQERIFSSELALYVGLGIIFVASLIIAWASHAGSRYRKHSHRYEELEHHHLKKGAFRFTRNPHYLGMGLLVVGLGFVLNSIAILILAALSFLIVNIWFIPHEEEVLAKRHGDHFDKYKDSTRKWF